jgi:hypothetical protein
MLTAVSLVFAVGLLGRTDARDVAIDPLVIRNKRDVEALGKAESIDGARASAKTALP